MTLFEEIVLGGKYAYTFKYGLYAVPALVFGTAVSEPNLGVNNRFWLWSAAAMLAISVAFIFLVVADKTVFKDRLEKPKPNSWVFILGLVLGAIKGTLTGLIAQYIFKLEPISSSAIFFRAFSAALIGMLALPILALIAYSWDTLHKMRSDLIIDLQGLNELSTLSESAQAGLISMQEAQYVAFAQKRIEEIKIRFQERVLSKETVSADVVAKELREIANELIRPLSHDASKRAVKTLGSRIKMKQLILLLPETITAGLPWFMSLYIVTARIHLQVFGFKTGLFTLTLDTVSLYLTVLLIQFLIRKSRANALLPLLIPVTLFTLRSKILFVVMGLIPNDSQPVSFLANAIWTSFAFFVVSLSSTYLVLRLRNLSRLRSEYSQKYIEVLRRDQTDHLISSQLARYLHGTVQTRLVASSFRIKSAEKNGSDEQVRTELQNVIEHLSIPKTLPSETLVTGLAPNLEKMQTEWKGLLSINTKIIGESATLNNAFVTRLCELLNEALSNALRHGDADQIDLIIDIQQNQVALSILDNGRHDLSIGAGLGSVQFDRIADLGWQLERNAENGKTLLTACMSLPH